MSWVIATLPGPRQAHAVYLAESSRFEVHGSLHNIQWTALREHAYVFESDVDAIAFKLRVDLGVGEVLRSDDPCLFDPPHPDRS